MASQAKSSPKQTCWTVGKPGQSTSLTNGNKKPTVHRPEKLSRQGSNLEILSADDEDSDGSRPGSAASYLTNGTSRPSSSSSRPNSSSRRAPPVKRGDSARSVNTPPPSKQVSLQTVRRRKEASEDLGELNWAEAEAAENDRLSSASVRKRREEKLAKDLQKLSVSQPGSHSTSAQPSSSALATGDNNNSPNQVNLEDSDEFDTDLEDGEEQEETSEEDVPIKAPNELMMEFLECVMTKDWQNSKKLCQMILIYEPENPEALSFKDLIEEKIQRGDVESEDDSSDEDEADGDDSSDDSDDDFWGSSSDSDDDDEEEDAEGGEDGNKDGDSDDGNNDGSEKT